MSDRAWMPLYIADYLADTGHLNAAEHGAYLMLIMHYWQKGSLPSDERLLARIGRMTPDQWAESRDVLAMLFGPDWTHKRIDAERVKADGIIAKRKAAAEARYANSKQGADAVHVQRKSTYTRVPPVTDNLSDGADAPSSSPEPAKAAPVASSPVVSELPCTSGEIFGVTEADVAEWSAAFPAVDVPQQIAAMRAWLNANPTKRKTKRGARKFIVSWLDRRQNAGGTGASPRATAPPGRRMNAVEAYLSLKSEQRHEPAGRTIDHRDDERVFPDEPGLQALVGDLGAAMRWPDGSGHH